ncbi:ribosome maturation factor RimM [Oceanobacillus profundus]|uniref:Ribosome maturation factor RimM n=1 Tax=Oceanobacillus profundus TaxID=372463 RepID=A0A417YK14_9BACI|nr:ribosome maturation factor RimM [Oceanobacillus profundus]MDO6449662.1 ribosome maturation factor RimM [Oceanobacillus profundus]PAE30008.1 ribosome maturation factor RimM [Paenibacillus sp. 7884-2]RHW33664.1 ribosome maturation factor RimM [Oceanobacillus profundus]
MNERMFNVGKIVNTHGIRGEVKVLRISDFEERFAPGEKLFVVKDEQSIELEITAHRMHKGFDLLQFEGYTNINDVETFKGCKLKISEAQLTELQQDEYYYHEIIGCEVFTTAGENIGKIKEILSPGANDVWVVKQQAGKDILIPYIDDVVTEVDVANKKIVVELMEGLLD